MKGWARQKRLPLAVKPADRQNKKNKSILKIKIQFDISVFLSYGYKLMSQDSREKFGVKTQISMWGGGGRKGGGWGVARKERKNMLRAGQSRGSIVCVNVV